MPWFETNISFLENITGHIRFVKMLVQVFFMCTSTYSNFLTVFSHILRSKYPIIGVFKDGTKIVLNNFYHANFFGKIKHSQQITYDLDEDVVHIITHPSDIANIKLKHAMNNGDIIDVYIDEIYRDLSVKGCTVIDIGANIGDSSIYFALKGSKRVIALEPFPKNYEMAKKNVELNNLNNYIKLVLGGCSNRNNFLRLDPNSSGVDIRINNSKSGTKVPLITLSQLIKDHNIEKQSILKIDCEGCEYDVILSSSSDVLQTFNHIFIEYHYGYKNLKRKLEESGFQVFVTSPSISGQLPFLLNSLKKIENSKKSLQFNKKSNNYDVSNKLTCVGQIHAIRI